MTTTNAVALRGYFITCLSSLVLSTTGLLIKFLLDDYGMPRPVLAFQRVFIVAVALGLALVLMKPAWLRLARRDVPLFLLYGIVGVGLHQPLWIASVSNNGVGVATVLVYIQPALVALVSWWFLGEAFSRTKVLALVLTLSGTVMVAKAYELNTWQLNPWGLLAGIGTGLTWTTYALLGRYATQRYAPWTAMFYAFLFGLLPLAALTGFTHGVGTWQLSGMAWVVLLVLSLGPTLGGFMLYTVGLSYLPASLVTLLGTLEPVFSIILAYLIFGEVLNLAQIIGAGLILWSVVMLRPR